VVFAIESRAKFHHADANRQCDTPSLPCAIKQSLHAYKHECIQVSDQEMDQANNTTSPSPTASFAQLSRRLDYLEKWYELAIRPTAQDCCEEDLDLLSRPDECDNVKALQQRCWQVRELRNQVLPLPPVVPGEYHLVPMTSQIPNAGMGLFYMPTDTAQVIAQGTTICYYSGNLHNASSANRLANRSYLMMLSGDVWVDAALCMNVKARYINDPLSADDCNCMFRPDSSNMYAQVVATRCIVASEELFAAYGDGYWSQQPTVGRAFSSVHATTQRHDEGTDSDDDTVEEES
jgi:hypothetical protein